jgi:transcriptional regulator GlxA family with amidase domain
MIEFRVNLGFMKKAPINIVFYLPVDFYSSVIAFFAETLNAINEFSAATVFTWEFVSFQKQAVSRTGFIFPARTRPVNKLDVLIVMSPGADGLLAACGVLDGKNATVSWWLRKLIGQRFPRVKWSPAQSPYEIPFDDDVPPFERELRRLMRTGIEEMSIPVIARQLGMSTRTLTRHFREELKVTPGRWLRQARIEMAKSLLQDTSLSVSEVCYRIGYTDLTSFSRLFTKLTGLGPAEYRRQSNLSVLT